MSTPATASALLVSCLLTLVFNLPAVIVAQEDDNEKILTENVALLKSCSMSSYHQHAHGSCQRALNGNTDGEFLGTDNCIHTEVGDMDPWFQVDLGRPYPIQSILLWTRNKHEGRMANSKITVDGEECFTFPSNTEHMGRKIVLNCTTPLSGQVVRISKEVQGKADGEQTLNICELQVFSCVEEAWGLGCDEQCGQCGGLESCDKVTGHCHHCGPGLTPPFCLLPQHHSGHDSHMTSSSQKLAAVTSLASAAFALAVTATSLP